MAIYKNRWFHRWAKKEGLGAPTLYAAVEEMAAGLFEADLGGGLLKKRIAREGQVVDDNYLVRSTTTNLAG